MADKRLSFNITAQDEASKVFEKVSRSAKSEMGKVDDSLDDSRTAGKRFADALSSVFEDLDAELAEVKQAADKLGQALGPELAGKVDTSKLVAEFQRAGLSINDIETEVDELAAAIKKADDVTLRHFTGEADAARKALGDSDGGLTDSARGANSALANMIGNTAQDLGAFTGITGSAGVAVGQLAEYASDARLAGEGMGSVLKGVAGSVLPIAALGLGVSLVSSHFERARKKAEELKRGVDEITDAIREGDRAAAASGLVELFEDEFRAAQQAGISVYDLTRFIVGLSGELPGTAEKMRDLNEAADESRDAHGELNPKLVDEAAAYENLLLKLRDARDDYQRTNGKLQEHDTLLGIVESSLGGAARATDDAADSTDDLTTANRNLRPALDSTKAGLELLRGQLDFDQAMFNFEDAFMTALANADGSVGNTREEILTLKGAVLDAATFAKLTPVEVKSLMDRIDAGDVLGVLQEVQDAFNRNRPVIRPIIGPATSSTGGARNAGPSQAVHSGTPAFQGGGVAMLGEHGPELAFVPDGTKVVSQSETKAMLRDGGGGLVLNVTVNAGMGANGVAIARDFQNALAATVRTNGRDSIRRLLGL